MARYCNYDDHEWVPSDNPNHVGGMVCEACGLDPEDAAIEQSMEGGGEDQWPGEIPPKATARSANER